jgi:hypothetical protein
MPNDYRIWGRIERVRPGEFLAIACAVPEDIAGDADTRVFNQVLPTKTAPMKSFGNWC